MSLSKNYYSGSILLQNSKNYLCSVINFSSKWLDKENLIPNPVYFNAWSFEIMGKIDFISSKQFFSSLNTYTTTKDLDTLNLLFTQVHKKYNRTFSFDSIKTHNKLVTDQQVIQFRLNKIKEYTLKEVNHLIKTRDKMSYITSDSNDYLGLVKDILFRLTFQSGSDIDYLRVLEFQKNNKPHFHTLSCQYVPEILVQETINNNPIFKGSNIFDTSFILDNYLRKNDDLKKEFRNSKPDYYKQVLNDSALKNTLTKFSFGYVTKYIIKEPEKTAILAEKKGYKNINIVRFSNSLYDKYPNLRRQKTDNNKLGRLPKPIKVPYYQYKPNIDSFEEILINDDLDIESTQEHFNNSKTSQEHFLNFLTHLNGSNLFDYHKNQSFLNIQNTFLEKDLGYLTQHTKLDLNKKGITCNNNLYSELQSKYCVSKSLRYIYENNVLNRFDNEKEKLAKVYSNLKQDESQLKVLNNFVSTPILNVIGRAGSGKTWTLSQLGVFNDKNTQLIVLTKKKRATQRLKEKYDSLGFKNVLLQNLDSFLIKRGNIYIKNEYNCIDSFNNYVLVLDEIGQITYNELNSIFAGINLDKIKRVVFGGDICQDKSFYGNSILDMLKDLDFIKELELKNNWRSNDKLNSIFNNFLENNNIDNYNILDFYHNEDKFKQLLQEKLNQNFTFIVNSKKLRDYVNSICLTFAKQKKILVDVNNRRYNLTNGDLYTIISQTQTHYTIKEQDSNKKLIIPNYIFDKHFIYAYALTVDKTQGDEFSKVCVLFDNYSKHLLTHNKLYTAMTRSKDDLEIYFESKEVYESCQFCKVTNDDLFLYKDIDELIYKIDGLNTLDSDFLIQKVNDVYYKG